MKTETLIIGDVHGCRQELEDLLKLAGYHKKMRLFFVGDLINKGPDSSGVLKLVHRLKAQVVVGNHELGFLKYVKKKKTGRPEFDEVRRQLGSRLQFWVDWMKALPLYIEEKDFTLVHAGLAPGLALADTPRRILTRIRTWDGVGKNLNHPDHPPWYEYYTQKRLVVFGHWAEAGLVDRPNAVGLDSGCVYGNQLSSLLLPQRKIVSTPARKVYRVADAPDLKVL